jgi:hypothetical protein
VKNVSPQSLYSEADVLAEVVAPDEANYPPELSEALLKLKFSSKAAQRMHELAEKNQRGDLNESEQRLLESYRRIGSLIHLLQAKARLSLK